MRTFSAKWGSTHSHPLPTSMTPVLWHMATHACTSLTHNPFSHYQSATLPLSPSHSLNQGSWAQCQGVCWSCRVGVSLVKGTTEHKWIHVPSPEDSRYSEENICGHQGPTWLPLKLNNFSQSCPGNQNNINTQMWTLITYTRTSSTTSPTKVACPQSRPGHYGDFPGRMSISVPPGWLLAHSFIQPKNIPTYLHLYPYLCLPLCYKNWTILAHNWHQLPHLCTRTHPLSASQRHDFSKSPFSFLHY